MVPGLKYDLWKFWSEHWDEIKDFDETDFNDHYKIVEFVVENMKMNPIFKPLNGSKWQYSSSIIDYFRDFKKDNIKNIIRASALSNQ